jgi:hypothetical protein
MLLPPTVNEGLLTRDRNACKNPEVHGQERRDPVRKISLFFIVVLTLRILYRLALNLLFTSLDGILA